MMANMLERLAVSLFRLAARAKLAAIRIRPIEAPRVPRGWLETEPLSDGELAAQRWARGESHGVGID